MKRVIALVAVAMWAAVLAVQWQAGAHDRAPHLPHAVAAAIGEGAEAMMLDHPHISDGTVPHSPDTFTAAVLPRTIAGAAALSVVAFIVGCAVLCGCAAVRATRGPPDRHGVLLAGQELLIRICIARR
ncbi:putative copper homeostasis (lipo)protein LpqS [Mycolicibacterium neworleansense]|uniref:Lipoprotein LpqS n=1 Tax=Mycolicibacterium neworleansense TaxID=146018 RepID=A0A0H5RX28_9MYCO|nr:hypothetical protein [Mycolicibacterium neworleansense]MCV7362501.1 hypothetical protein [Mycolicibacterium neworleansense]CRZ18092.1 lipoprotein LpqS [Mycolicibacterium neworleansense]